ncbi:type VII secretion integral membrane protein EccD [Streptomyces sp. AF1A]|uniref:type VII secretion integral membrane protein EccD n=1 Tax=Streptomyces sp. AF1A TaxID=3394350 RepID=UPI0039BC4CBF
MSVPSDQGLCHISILGPRSRVDLALPVHLSFAELLPAVIGYTGGDLAEAGVEHEGWVLQRVDEPPLPLGATPAEVGLRHGETLHLRPRTRPLPDISVLELVDPLTGGEDEAADRWGPRWSNLSTQVALAVALAGLAALLLRSGERWSVRALLAAALSVVALLGSWAVPRRRAETWSALVPAVSAPAFAFLAAVLRASGGAPLRDSRPAWAAYGLLAAAVAAAVAAWAAPAPRPVSLGCAAAYVFGAMVCGADAAWPGWPAPALAVVTLCVVLPVSVPVPSMSLLLAARRLRSDTLNGPFEPVGSDAGAGPASPPAAGSSRQRLLQRASDVRSALSVCATALTVLGTGAGLVLAVSGGRWGRAGCVLAAGALVLCARRFDGGAQRTALLTSAAVIVAGAAVASAADSSPLLGTALPAAVLAAPALGALLTGGRSRGGRRPAEWNALIPSARARLLTALEVLIWLALAATVVPLVGG